MATLKTKWLLYILLVNLPNSPAAAGPPPLPSKPKCYILCDDSECSVEIHCIWDGVPDPQIPTIYSLHWEPSRSTESHVTVGTNSKGSIRRAQYASHSDLRVWVQAENQHGISESEKVVFNTANIRKPSPPKIILSYQELFEISWNFTCNELLLFVKQCDVRHRTEEDPHWNEHEAGVHGSYTFIGLQRDIDYEFQVRCGCSKGMMSDWSETYKVTDFLSCSGKLDLWRDCGISPTSVDCVLTWKYHSHILGYKVELSGNNGTVLVNLSTAKPCDLLVCDEKQCYLNSSLVDVLSASVTAYNAYGSTVASYLTIPTQAKEKNEQPIDLKMNEENLTVSWDLLSQLSGNLSYKAYVVQYKQAESPLGHGFDWIKVKEVHKTVSFIGQFKKYTPYQVSLFSESHNGECHYLSSVIGYSLQGTPSEVPLFKVDSISATCVTLLWEPVPLFNQKGMILYYQIGIDRQNVVYNVNPSQQHENQAFQMPHLSPDQDYVVWIRAVTAAGPGANATVRFKTKLKENYAHLISILLILPILTLVIICCGLLFHSAFREERKVCPLVPLCFYEKVPDPRNSHILRQLMDQINDPMASICIPINEPRPNVSLLEVMEIQPRALESSLETTSHPDGLTKPVVGDRSSQIDCQDNQKEDAVTEECNRTERRREEYSKMVDSDEERDREEEEEEDDRDNSWSSSEEEQLMSGYEKHFMPTFQEVLEV
ncbi:hypothetical protein PAMP_009303 [Pampus punctatissimus]